jgi:hypothetical protein
MSLLQSALEERIEAEHADLIVHDGEDASGRRRADDALTARRDLSGSKL